MAGRPKRSDLDFLHAAAEIWDSDPDIGYTARLWAQTSLPYRDPKDIPAWGRRNGDLVLAVQPGVTIDRAGKPVSLGYPFGTVPRMLLNWLATEAVCTKTPELVLGNSLAAFMRALGMTPTGGKTGTIPRLRTQMHRLFNARISVRWEGNEARDVGGQLTVASAYDLWWSENEPDELHQASLLPSTVRLSAEFYKEIVEHPVPVDLACLRVLAGSALRLDIYTWLTHRMSYLRRPSLVPWEALKGQFGSNLANTRQGLHQFRRDFARELGKVCVAYREANVEVTPAGILLKPSLTSVPFRDLRELRQA